MNTLEDRWTKLHDWEKYLANERAQGGQARVKVLSLENK